MRSFEVKNWNSFLFQLVSKVKDSGQPLDLWLGSVGVAYGSDTVTNLVKRIPVKDEKIAKNRLSQQDADKLPLPMIRADLYRFELTFRNEGDEWDLVDSEWRQITPEDLLEE